MSDDTTGTQGLPADKLIAATLRTVVPEGTTVYLVERHKTRGQRLIVDFKVRQPMNGAPLDERLISIARELSQWSHLMYVEAWRGLMVEKGGVATRLVRDLSSTLYGDANKLRSEWV